MAADTQYKETSAISHFEKVNHDTDAPEDQKVLDLNRNTSARIANPLAGIPREQLLREVEQFAHEANMIQTLPLLRKGALLAQSPTEFESLEDLDNDEREVLQEEARNRWDQPSALYFTIILCSIGACVQGWDQTGANGANLSFPQALGIAAATGEPNYTRDAWLVGAVNAAPSIACALLGCWLADPLNNYLGRRGAIFFAAIFCILPVIGSGLCQTWQQLFVCRLLLGIGMGCKASTIPIYAAENSPTSIRGALVMTWQMWTAFGVTLGVSANLALYRVGPIAWRLQLGSAFLPAVPLALGIYFCPESPRWYLKKKRYEDAYRSLCRLRKSKIQACRDLYAIHAQLELEDRVIGKHGNFAVRLLELFTVPRNRRASYAAFTVMVAQQMCGINIIAFYSSTIFVKAGATVEGALFASFGFGLIVWIFAFPAFKYIDTFGRRSLLLLTFPQMAWSLLAAGLCNLIPQQKEAHLVLIAFFVYLFSAFYAGGEGPVPFVYAAEVFPLTHREVGMSFATATTFFWSSILSLTFPRLLGALGTTGAFGFYTGTNVLALIMIFFIVPETKQRSLEELDYVFAVPTRIHIRYQITKALPYGIRRYVLFDRKVQLEPLYHM